MARSGSSGDEVSVEQSRQALREDLMRRCQGTPITKEIPFINDDVPRYLEVLAGREEASKESDVVVS
jgi:hypothetical protein